MQNIYITGRTFSTNLPVTSGAYDTTNSGSEAFVIKLNPTGTNLVYATYLGNGGVQGFDIAVNNNGEAYVVGQTISVSFPTTAGAYDRINNGWDGFVTRFNAAGSGLIFSTYLGGTADDCEISTDLQECSIALDSSGAVYIAGHTLSSDFPTTVGAYDRIYNSNFDMFVSKLQPNGSALIYSTFLGGSGNDWCMPECGIDVDKDGYAYIVGTTSGNFPTTVSAYDRIYNGGSSDLVIVKLTQNGGGVVYSTYLGESGSDTGHAITVENGFAMVTGETTSANFPFTPDAFQETFGGGTRDAFVTFLDPDGGGFVHSTYLGGSGDEFGLGISSTPNGNIVATGVTGSNNFPTTSGTYANSYVTNFNFATSIIFDPSVLNNCYSECYESAATNSNGTRGGPINTRTGGLFYQTEDIYVPTTSKPLTFHRTYSSLATDLYPTTLGYGWTHSLESRLIFPGDPDGEAGYLLFKLHTANRYQFIINEDGTYSSAPGVTGTMTYTGEIYALTLPDQSIYTFDVNGRLQTWADVEEHLWNYSYNANNQLEQISADSGTRYFTISYDPQGRIASVADHTGRNVTFGYDPDTGDLVSVTDVLLQTWTYEYVSHRLTRVLDPLGKTIERTEYDDQGRAVRQWDGLDNLVGELTYNADGTTVITDIFGETETHSYDSRRTLISDTDPLGGATDKTYDNNFRPSTITDADENTTTLTWSADGANLQNVEDALGNQTSIIYDALNNPTSVVGPAPYNYLTTYEYDGTHLTSIVDSTQGETTYTYTPEGYLESVTDGEDVTTTYGYDSHGQRTSITDDLQNTREYTYDNLGRLTDEIDPLDRVTHNEYDTTGRLTRVTRNYDPNRPRMMAMNGT